MTYDLSDNVSDSFQFKIDGFVYNMKYPNLDEAEKVQKLLEEDDSSLKVIEVISKFITPEQKDAPNIVSVLRKKNVKVLQNFSKMIQEEFIGSD